MSEIPTSPGSVRNSLIVRTSGVDTTHLLLTVNRVALLGSRSGEVPSCSQARNQGAEQGFAASTSVVYELEKAEIERQLVLRDAPVRAQPGAPQPPRAFDRVDVDLAEALTAALLR